MIEAAAPCRPPVDHRETSAAAIGVAARAAVAGLGRHPPVKTGLLLDSGASSVWQERQSGARCAAAGRDRTRICRAPRGPREVWPAGRAKKTAPPPGAQAQRDARAQQEGRDGPHDQNHVETDAHADPDVDADQAHQHDRQRHVHHPPDRASGASTPPLEPELELQPSQLQRLLASCPPPPPRKASLRVVSLPAITMIRQKASTSISGSGSPSTSRAGEERDQVVGRVLLLLLDELREVREESRSSPAMRGLLRRLAGLAGTPDRPRRSCGWSSRRAASSRSAGTPSIHAITAIGSGADTFCDEVALALVACLRAARRRSPCRSARCRRACASGSAA